MNEGIGGTVVGLDEPVTRETAQRACRFQATSILGELNGQFCVDRNHPKRSVTGERNPEVLSGFTQPKMQPCAGTPLRDDPPASQSGPPMSALPLKADVAAVGRESPK
jgi:hypothetical protein